MNFNRVIVSSSREKNLCSVSRKLPHWITGAENRRVNDYTYHALLQRQVLKLELQKELIKTIADHLMIFTLVEISSNGYECQYRSMEAGRTTSVFLILVTVIVSHRIRIK